MSNIKQGYKQTDIGIIPEDWEVKSIADISTPVRGGSPRPAGSPKYFNGNFIPWLTVASLTNVPNSQIIINQTATSLTEEGSYHSRILEKGTLIIANSGATLGVAKLLGIKCCANDGIAALLNIQSKYDKEYILFHINNITEVLRNSIATGNGQPNLNTQLIGNLRFPYPKETTEQTAIATALSDTDALIAALDKKIAKKQQIKQGAMQQLLTGKKRLSGFSGEWVEKKLGELLDYEQPTDYIVKSTDYLTQGIPVLTAGKSFILGYTTETKGVFENTPVIIFDDFTTATKFVDFKFKVKSSAMKILKLKEQKNNIKLIFELMQLIIFPMIDHQRYWISEYSKIIIKIPSTIDEQTAISQILTDMDNEIAQLEKERDKYKELKAGMMQVLLTGKVRLV